MGMRVNSSSALGTTQSSSVSNWQQRQQSLQSLTAALQSGDLAGAQKAFSGLSNSSNVQGNSPLAKLGQALQSGDLSGAQQALQNLQSSRGHHHHHSQQTTASSSSGTTSGTTGSNIDVIAG